MGSYRRREEREAMLYILWVILSAAFFSTAVYSDRYEWLVFPGFISLLCAIVCGLYELAGALPM